MDQTFKGGTPGDKTEKTSELARQLVQFAALGFLKDRDPA
jgi:hypothetical protein